MNDLEIYTENALLYYLGIKDREIVKEIGRDPGSFYTSWDEPKSNGGTRPIDKPNKHLKHIQRKILHRILYKHKFESGMYGYIEGSSYIDNAKHHRGQKIITNIDIAGFFNTTKSEWVYSAFRDSGLNEKVSELLVLLTCYKGRIPQGTPTSGALANLVLEPVFRGIKDYTNSKKLKVSVYADDVTFSGNHAGDSKVVDSIIKPIYRKGYKVKQSKVRVMWNNTPQIVTGVLLNDNELDITPKQESKIQKYFDEIKLSGKLPERDVRSLTGLINSTRQINKKTASKYLETYKLLLGSSGKEVEISI